MKTTLTEHLKMPPQPPPSDSPLTNIVALDTHIMRRGPGRPRKFDRAPTEAESALRENVRARLHRHVAADPVVSITSNASDRTSPDALDALMLEIAREAAGLGFDAQRAVVESRPDSESEKTSSRRVAALVRLGDLVLARARAGIEQPFDARDARVQSVMREFVREMTECARETLGSADAERFLTKFAQLSQGWEDRSPA